MKDILGRVSGGEDLSMDEMSSAIDTIMQGRASDEEIAMLLTALRAKGETVDEVAGAAAAMRKHMTTINSHRDNLVDTCGTGGTGSGTFNISTAAALVAAAAGVSIAKHGNRRITSKTGSADVLMELGVSVEASVETVEKCLDEVGICFCFAPLLHGSMKHVAAVRRSLGVPTIFNMLGPLCNPASAEFQLLGVGRPEIRNLLAAALAKLGIRHAFVVSGEDGMDEITIGGSTNVTEVKDGALTETTWTPGAFGISEARNDALLAENPVESAAVIRGILDGQSGPPRDIVVINAAAAIHLADASKSLDACARRCEEAIDGGAAKDLLARLAAVSNS